MTDEAREPSNNEQPEDRQQSRERLIEARLIEARLALLAASYPTLVTEESRELIRSEIGSAIARDVRLRRYQLGNGDESMALFRPYRSAEPEDGA